SALRYPEFRQTAFVSMAPAITDRFPGDTPPERDARLAQAFDEFARGLSRTDPFFAFLFLDSPHFPHVYPPEYTRHQPIDADPRRNGPALFIRYRNSVFYADTVIGQILTTLERAGLADRTIVAITGDHGQEFGEHGFHGHGSAFTPEQTQVPLILFVPGLPF